MKPLKNSNAGANLTLESNGVDIIILPSKKKKKQDNKRRQNQLNVKKQPKLSKSQIRKLKKLEEEKEKEILLSKSIETLEKYKIKDDVYSLMWSLRNLGQVETVREKRRREVEFSKAGLELPQSGKAHTKRKKDNASENIDIQVYEDEISLPDTDVHLDTSMQPLLDGRVGVSFEEVENDNTQPSLPEFGEKSTQSSQIEEIFEPMDAMAAEPSCKHGGENDRSKCTLSINLVAPTVVHVSRPKEVEEQRIGLPIVGMEQEIMEAINENSSLIICGKTGCGKTTQVPQFLYEAGFGSRQSNIRGGIIGVTQPRRVAVLATAKRVAFELGLGLGKEVGFQVRHDRKVGENCAIKFMTDGILLRELQNDFMLKRYSVLILDEAHERSLNTDILIGMLSLVIQKRQSKYETQEKQILAGETIERENKIYPLKLVLMSATLRVEDFGNKIFRSPPPVFEVETPKDLVDDHFLKKTEIVDYIGQAYKKVLSIHKRLPPGGILVFVTGQREVELLCQRLRRSSRKLVENAGKVNSEGSSSSVEKSPEEINMKEISEAFDSGHDITECYNADMEEDNEDFPEYESDSEEESDSNTKVQDVPQTPEGNDKDKSSSPGQLHVLPLYAMLPASSQLRVFEKARDGERLVVVATNVAETSLTIPGIKYVVDTGKEKVKNYNSSSGMETYEIQWISKASAAQRKGRAGRTGPGHCYRLYSPAVFIKYFPDFSTPEISKVPLDGVVLLLKSMDILESMDIDKVEDFPFPTPPKTTALIEAEDRLKVLEALDKKGNLTSLGRAMARYPMNPRHSRMLLTVIQILQKAKKCPRANLVLAYAVAVAAALSMSNPFLRQFEDNRNDVDDKNHAEEADSKGSKEEKLREKELKQIARTSREKFSNPTSDALTVAFALQSFDLSDSPTEFCYENALHYKTMEEMSKLRKQLLELVFSSSINGSQQDFYWAHGTMEDVESTWVVSSDKNPLQPNEEEILRQAICAGWADRVAKRIKGASPVAEGDRNTCAVRYQACTVKETIFLHRRSSISRSAPEFLVYTELLCSKRPYIHGATKVEANWLAQYAFALCTFSTFPLAERKPYYDPMADQVLSLADTTFSRGPHLWPLPPHGLPIEDDSKRVRVVAFSYCLLDGQILSCLKKKDVKNFMALSPATMLKPEAKGLKRVDNLLSKLTAKGRAIDSLAKLRKVWKENPLELFPEIKDWFLESFHHQFEKLWEDMLREALSDPERRLKKRVKKSKREV
ncbi:hypothetical protein OROGR_011995 [Orobanche gracilis]